MCAVVLLVGLAGRFRRWWLLAAPVIVAIAAIFAFASGWLGAAGTHPLQNRVYAADAARLERIEHVTGTPVRVQRLVRTDQANAFTIGFGPSTHVVIWNTLLDGRFSRGEIDATIARELGHVRSRHVLKAIGWSALIVIPTLWLLDLITRRRGGVGDPVNLPFVFLVLALLMLLAAPIQARSPRRIWRRKFTSSRAPSSRAPRSRPTSSASSSSIAATANSPPASIPRSSSCPQNRVDLIFKINEGPKTGVARVNFIGNKVFDDEPARPSRPRRAPGTNSSPPTTITIRTGSSTTANSCGSITSTTATTTSASSRRWPS